jgi:hypothetical protein
MPGPIRLANEFASVKVELDVDASGPRLRITDLATGVFACLDPFELQSLAWARHADLAALLSPAHREAVLDWSSTHDADGR